MIFNFNDLSKQAKIGYNALYNVILAHSTSFDAKTGVNKFTIPLCLNSDNKVSLTEKNFIFFGSVLQELKLFGFYNLVQNNGRAVDEVKTDFLTIEVYLSKDEDKLNAEYKQLSDKWGKSNTVFCFSDIDTSKLLKRDGKAEKAKTKENKTKKEEEKKEQEKTSKELEEKTSEIETLKKEVAKKDEQLNKKAIAEFNDDALLSIAYCIESLVKKHCKMVPANFDFSAFEVDLFKAIENGWAIEK